jgi:hypothetical protein
MAGDAKLGGNMTQAEARAYNMGVEAVLAIARRSAAAIAGTSQRRVHEDFAVAALAELAEAARTLLITVPNPGDQHPSSSA